MSTKNSYKTSRFYHYLCDISEWISPSNYNPFSLWLPYTYTHQSGGVRYAYSYLVDKQTAQLYINESTGMVRTKHGLLLLADLTIHAIGVPLMMIRDIFCLSACIVCALFNLTMFKFQGFIDFLQLANKLLISLIAKPFAWISMLMCNLLGATFLPYGCRKVYASLERDVYQTPVIAPCFQPVLKNQPQRKRNPICLLNVKCGQKQEPKITHLFGSAANKPGW